MVESTPLIIERSAAAAAAAVTSTNSEGVKRNLLFLIVYHCQMAAPYSPQDPSVDCRFTAHKSE